MYNIKHGYGCGIKATLLTASGEVCDLRRARYKGAVLVLPNGSTIPCADVSVDDITNTMYVRLLGDRELTTIGRYGILFNVKLANGVMYSSPIVMFADVQDDAEMEYRELNISIAVTVTYLPANVAYTGASPKISPNGTWLVYNDELNAYEDTGEPASYAGVAGNIQELHEQIDERTTTTYITEAVDVDWKTVGKNAEGKLCVIGGDTQVADFIEGYLLANGYAKLSELAKIFASIEWIEGKKYITDADIPSLVSAFTNDKGYITLDAIAPYAKKATTLGGYGITNAYTKEETESRFFAFTKIDNETIKRNEDGFMYVDFSNVPTSIFDGLPIDNETIYWDNGVLKAMGGGGGGGVADSVAWANVVGKPTWITNTKPTYNYSEIKGTPDLSVYALASAIPTNNNQLTNGAGYITSSALNGYATQTFVNTAVNGAKEWVEEQQYLTEITSGMIESVLGYQPYDGDTNRLGFLTSSALNGYATQSWVNTALAGYLPLSGGTVNGSITASSFIGNLTGIADSATNADTLDGKHATDLVETIILTKDSNSLDLNSRKSVHTWFSTGWAYEGSDKVLNQPWRSSAANVWTLPGLYPLQIAKFYNSNDIRVRGTGGGSALTDWKQIAFTDSNVASATKLETPRTIWGQSFDGTGNVAGAFTTTDYIRTSKYIETGFLQLTSGIDGSFRTSVFGDAAAWGRMKALRTGGYETGSYGVLPGKYTTAMAFAMSDTHAFIAIPSAASRASQVVVGGGNADKLNWSATLLHSLNYSDYALPITGGTIKGNLLTTGGITMYSQRSLKNILSYDGLSLEQLSVIKPIKFTWKDGRDNRYHVGGVADDVETVVPEVVYSANDFLTMDYGNAGFYVAASLIKPVIDHEQRIQQLEQENKALRDEINQLKQAA
jgi:hypothetical protein